MLGDHKGARPRCLKDGREDFKIEREIRYDNNFAVLKDGREDIDKSAFHDGTNFRCENLHERHKSLFLGTEVLDDFQLDFTDLDTT